MASPHTSKGGYDMRSFAGAIVVAIFAVTVFASADAVTTRFLPPEGLMSIVRTSMPAGAEDVLLAKPFVLGMGARALAVLGAKWAWTTLAALGGTALAAVAVFLARKLRAPWSAKTGLCCAALASPSLLCIATAFPADAFAVASLALCASFLFDFSRSGRTFSLFAAGFALGVAPLAAAFSLAYAAALLAGIGFCLGNRPRDERRALVIVLFAPISLLLGGWAFLHWAYGHTFTLSPLLPIPFAAEGLPILSAASLGICATVVAWAARRSTEGSRLWALHCLLWLFLFLGLPTDIPRLPLLLLGTLFVLAGATFISKPRATAALPLLFALHAAISWIELPHALPVFALWQRAASGERVLEEIYPEDAEAAVFVRNNLSSSDVVIVEGGFEEGVRFFAQPRVLVRNGENERAVARYALRPAFAGISSSETILFRNGTWILVAR